MAKATGLYTIVAVSDGERGQNAIQAVLTNENHTLTADSTGAIISYAGAVTTITVYDGATDVTSQYTITKVDGTGITSTISGSTITVTNISNGIGGNITINATKGSNVLTKVFALSVSKAGQKGEDGQPGTSAKLVNVVSSSQVFKSTTGGSGTFTPQYIYLYPAFQGVTYSKWQYSTDGTTWTDVTSGSHSMTIGTYNSVPNALRLERNSDVYTSSVTAISFKCISSDATVYDTITIIKVYDSGDGIIKSDTEPSSPTEGMIWLNTTSGVLSVYQNGQWVTQDMSNYATSDDIDNLSANKNKTFISQPTVPYRAGDLWIVTDKTDPNYGKILTCTTSKETSESFNIEDWIVPLTAYTTVTQMTNVIGTDPSEWSSESKSVMTLINENTGEVEGINTELANLSVRASGIEMSFSKTGTMNFLGNSSGQNNLKGWTISSADLPYIKSISSREASDVNQSLVSLSAFRFDMHKSDLTMTSSVFTPPTSSVFTVSVKVKNPGKYSYITLTTNLYSDLGGTTLLGTQILNIPYVEGAEDEFCLFHMSVDKSQFGSVQSAKLIVNAVQPKDYISQNPSTHLGKIADAGNIYYYNSTYTYIKSVYKTVNIVQFDTHLQASSLSGDTVYKCMKDLQGDALSNNNPYVRGVYYTTRDDTLNPKLRPISDSYEITMLDSGDYKAPTMTGGNENKETSSSMFSPSPATIYLGDIMVNGGSNVQTWTPRQDENLWGEYIKFDSSGITIENIPLGYSRILNSSADIAYKINESGEIIACIWKLTPDGFITKDINCYGTFSMGHVTNEASVDLDNDYVKVMEMKRSTANDGVDEYIYT